MRWMTGSSARARLLRAFVSTTVCVVVAIDLLHEYVPRIFFEGNPFLSWVSTAGFAVITGALIARVAMKVGNDMDRSEAALKKREQELAIILRTAMDGFWITDRAGRFLEVNDAVCAKLGYSRDELLRMSVSDVEAVQKSEDIDRVIRTIVEKGSARFEGTHRCKDGSLLNVEISVNYLPAPHDCFFAFIRDITGRKAMESQLRQSQKMEAVGRLAGGVAHDFNNLLTVILGYSEALGLRFPAGHSSHREVKEIEEAGKRAAALTRQLLAFSRKQILQPRVIGINTVVTEMDRMIRRLIGEDIDIVTALGGGLWSVKADPGQIEQVLMNLVVNARDAMPDGGKLTIETANVVLSREQSRRHIPLEPGSYVMLAVSDTGTGMDEETKSHVFEPFFTTKERGKGTGLGLSTVYGIVKQSGGYIWIDSEVGKGSTFKVYLPRTEEAGDRADKEAPAVEDLRGRETVLVVEDDPSIRKLAAEVLGQYGYRVLTAADGDEALRTAREHGGTIGLLLTDVVMPRMGGRELCERLREVRPDVKTLFMSGYTENAIVHHGKLDPGIHFLQKPFAPASLARKVKEVLGGK